MVKLKSTRRAILYSLKDKHGYVVKVKGIKVPEKFVSESRYHNLKNARYCLSLFK